MTDAEKGPETPKKSGPPRWMIGLGCGCVVPGFLIIASLAFALQLGQKLFNQNEAYDALAELIPFDESLRGTPTGESDNPRTPRDESRNPRGMDLVLGGEIPISGGVHAFWFARDIPVRAWGTEEFGPDPMRVSIVRIRTDQSDAATRASQGTPLHVDTEFVVGERTLRARMLPELRDDGFFFSYFHGVDEMAGAGAAVWLQEAVPDPEEDGETFDLIAFFQRPRSSRPIEAAEVAAFLAPFDLTPPDEADQETPAAGDEPQAEEEGR